MNYNNTDLVNLSLNNSDAKEIIPSEMEKAVNTLLATELTEFLKYEKHSVDGYNTGNSRNGYYSRTLSTSYGDISISVPKDRNGEFKAPLFNKYARRTESLEATIILMYKRGLTTREISYLIEKMYGSYYSPQTISNITAVKQEQVALFVSNGFVGLPEAIQTIFPDSMHQRCWVHIQRNISRKVRVKDRELIASNLKRVYTQPN